MESFLEKHVSKTIGVLSCFDRMLFRGYLPIMSGGTSKMSSWSLDFRQSKGYSSNASFNLLATFFSRLSPVQSLAYSANAVAASRWISI